MTFGSMSVMEPTTILQDPASLAAASASQLLAASNASPSPAVAAAAGPSTGSDATGSSSSGGPGAGATDSGEETVELAAAASSPEVLIGDTSPAAAASGTTSPSRSSGSTENARAETAAALVEISGASSLTVNNYLMSVPPNMATATALTNELTTSGNISYAAASSVYTLLDASATLALTSD
jgi:hypothetical protein